MVAPTRKKRFKIKQNFVPKNHKTWKIPFKVLRQIGGGGGYYKLNKKYNKFYKQKINYGKFI
jgi:hypothetical protein